MFFALQLTAAKMSLERVVWNGDFTKPALTAKLCSTCLESLPNLKTLSVLPREPKAKVEEAKGSGLADSLGADAARPSEVRVDMFEVYEFTAELADLQR